jgi:hypothetical protein
VRRNRSLLVVRRGPLCHPPPRCPMSRRSSGTVLLMPCKVAVGGCIMAVRYRRTRDQSIRASALLTFRVRSSVRAASLCCLRVHNPLRKRAIRLLEHEAFEPCVALMIVVNVSLMAWSSPLEPAGTHKAAFIAICEWVFICIFTVEASAPQSIHIADAHD